VKEKGMVRLCRCYKSSTFPYCDGSHDSHNETCKDSAGPVVIKSLPEEARGLNKLKIPGGFKPALNIGNTKRANNYGVPANMPPDAPCKRVDVVDIEDLAAKGAKGEVTKFCRCWKSKEFPFCDDSHNDHNAQCGDNAGPLVIA
jgi:CDGSH-type Zn-finger protein